MRTTGLGGCTARRGRRWMAAALVVALASVAVAQVSTGDRRVDEGRFADAIAAYEAVLAGDPGNARALYRLARAAVYLASELPAEEAAEREAWFARAAEAAERAAELAPDDPDAHFEVARALGRLAQYRGVLQSLNLAARVSRALDRTIELDPDHAAAWHARALFHRDVPWIAGGRPGQVIPSFERAIASEPDVIAHRVELARVYLDRNDPAAARTQLEVALSLTPRTYLDRRDLEEAHALQARLP